MNKNAIQSYAKIFAFLFLMLSFVGLQAQPAGKWYPGQTLPGLTSSGKAPKLLFVDSLLGYYIGVDTGFVTHDAGMTWQMMNFPSNARPSPTYVFTPSHNTIISFQAYNTDSDGTAYPGIIKSTDMGKNWTLVSSEYIPNNFKIKAFTMWTDMDGFRIWEDDNTSKFYSAATHDGGLTFTDMRTDATLEKYDTNSVSHGKYPATVNLNSAWSDSLHGAISVSPINTSTSSYPVLTTTNGGRTWTETYPKYNGSTSYSHSFVYLFPGSQTIWAVPSVPKTAIYFFYSTNFGTDWTTTTPFNKRDLGTNTKPGVVQLAPVSPSATWAILASDTEHPDLRHFIGYNDISSGWKRDTIFSLQGSPYSYSLNEIQFTSVQHGWALLAESYFDSKQGLQITKDSTFIFVFNPATPVSDVRRTSDPAYFQYYPNPASSKLKIQGLQDDEQLREITLFTMLGVNYLPTVIHSGKEIELDIRSLPPGCYFASITTSARTEVIPVVVMH